MQKNELRLVKNFIKKCVYKSYIKENLILNTCTV